MVDLPDEYEHSSAKYYFTGEQGIYPVTNFMELRDIDLTKCIHEAECPCCAQSYYTKRHSGKGSLKLQKKASEVANFA